MLNIANDTFMYKITQAGIIVMFKHGGSWSCSNNFKFPSLELWEHVSDVKGEIKEIIAIRFNEMFMDDFGNLVGGQF